MNTILLRTQRARAARFLRLATGALLASTTVACFQPWPGRPPKHQGEIKQPVDGDEAIVAKFRGGKQKYPEKAYWIAEPKWLPERSPLGIITGRYTDNTVLALFTRYDGSPDGWPDLCQYREVSLKEVATNADGTEFAKTEIRAGSTGEIDCAVYDAAK